MGPVGVSSLDIANHRLLSFFLKKKEELTFPLKKVYSLYFLYTVETRLIIAVRTRTVTVNQIGS